MYRSARPLLALGRPPSAAAAAAVAADIPRLPQTLLIRVAPSTTMMKTARRIPIAAAATTRVYSMISKPDLRLKERLQKKNSKSEQGVSAKDKEAAQRQQISQILLPGTFIHLPWSKLDKRPGPLLDYLYNRYRQHLLDFVSILLLKFRSMPKLWKRPALRVNRRDLVSIAEEMHLILNKALAEGDKETLRKTCAPRLYDTLSAVVSRRKLTEALTWQLLRYEQSSKLISHRMTPLPPIGKGPIMQQAVIAIHSTQMLARIDKKTGKPFPSDGSKIEKQLEYFVIMRSLDYETYKPEEWRVWGGMKPTTAESWVLEQASMRHMERTDFAKRTGINV